MGKYPNFADLPCWIRRVSLRGMSEITLNMSVCLKSDIKSYSTTGSSFKPTSQSEPLDLQTCRSSSSDNRCYRQHRYRHTNFSQVRRLNISHGNLNNWTWYSGNSWISTSWLGLHVWPESNLFVGVNTHFPLIAFHVSLLLCVSKKWRDTIHELFH
jgi:hypothetical protein